MGMSLSNSGPECDPVITIRMGWNKSLPFAPVSAFTSFTIFLNSSDVSAGFACRFIFENLVCEPGQDGVGVRQREHLGVVWSGQRGSGIVIKDERSLFRKLIEAIDGRRQQLRHFREPFCNNGSFRGACGRILGNGKLAD